MKLWEFAHCMIPLKKSAAFELGAKTPGATILSKNNLHRKDERRKLRVIQHVLKHKLNINRHHGMPQIMCDTTEGCLNHLKIALDRNGVQVIL